MATSDKNVEIALELTKLAAEKGALNNTPGPAVAEKVSKIFEAFRHQVVQRQPFDKDFKHSDGPAQAKK